MAVAAAMGAGSAAAGDAATQGAHMGAGIQENYNPTQTAIAAGVGGVVGAGSVPLGQAIKSSLDRREVAKALAKELQNSEPVLAAKTPSVGPEQVRPVVKDTTGTIVTEGPKLQAAGELKPQVVSASRLLKYSRASEPAQRRQAHFSQQLSVCWKSARKPACFQPYSTVF